MPLYPSVHIDLVEAVAVGGVGKAGFQFGGVAFGLGHTQGVGFSAPFGFNHSQFVAPIFQHVIGKFGSGPPPMSHQSPRGDDFSPHSAVFYHAPASGPQGGVN